MEMTLEWIEALIDLATRKHLAELTVESDHQKVEIKTSSSVPTAQRPDVTTHMPPEPRPETPERTATHFYKVTSPMVGTFYKSPGPDSPPFAEVGSHITKGQPLCIIEAMKLMNELESEVSGIVRRVLVDNGKPVEFGQVLMEIEVQ